MTKKALLLCVAKACCCVGEGADFEIAEVVEGLEDDITEHYDLSYPQDMDFKVDGKYDNAAANKAWKAWYKGIEKVHSDAIKFMSSLIKEALAEPVSNP